MTRSFFRPITRIALLSLLVLPLLSGGVPAGEQWKSLPKTAEKMRGVMGRDYLYIEKGGLLIVSDLDKYTLDGLTKKDMFLYMQVLQRDFFDKPQRSVVKDSEIFLTVFLFKNRDSYVKGLRKININVAEEDENNQDAVRDGYFYGGKERNFILINYHENYEQGISIYAHELCHALMRREFYKPPSWLNEGIATMIGHSKLVDGRFQYDGDSGIAGAKRMLDKGEIPPLSRILAATGKDFSARQGSYRIYVSSEQFCRYLQSSNALRTIYRALRDESSNRGKSAEVVSRTTGLTLEKLEKVWHAWLRKQE